MASAIDSSAPPLTLLVLPVEILLLILAYLDIPDLLNVSRTVRPLRRLCFDPQLHAARRLRASVAIERLIPCRPPLSELVQHRIYFSRTNLAARDLGRNLIKIKLNRSLARRPSAERLVQLGVLPQEYLHKRFSPSLISTKRRIERERVKDVLRHAVGEWSRKVSRAAKQEQERERPLAVSVLAARFTRKAQASADGPMAPSRGDGTKMMEMPTRAKVWGLRRFWEKVGQGA